MVALVWVALIKLGPEDQIENAAMAMVARRRVGHWHNANGTRLKTSGYFPIIHETSLLLSSHMYSIKSVSGTSLRPEVLRLVVEWPVPIPPRFGRRNG
jgi:hypothetical protein